MEIRRKTSMTPILFMLIVVSILRADTKTVLPIVAGAKPLQPGASDTKPPHLAGIVSESLQSSNEAQVDTTVDEGCTGAAMRAELLESILPSEASVFESLGQSMASELRALGSSIAWDQPLEEAARRIPVRAYAEVIQGPNSTGTEWPVLRVPASSPTSVQLFGGGFVSHTIERAGGCSAVNSSSTYEIAPDRWVGVYVGGDLPLMEYIDVDKCIKHGSVTFEESLQAVANGRTPILQAGGASESSDACTTSEMQYARCTYGMRPWACSARKTQLGTRT